MKRMLTFLVIALMSFVSQGQGYGVSTSFYPFELPEGKDFDQNFWSKELKKLNKKTEKNPDDRELNYALAVAKSQIIGSDLTESIKILDTLIAQDSTNANYYAVRGILKHDLASFEHHINGTVCCDDIFRAMALNPDNSLRKDLAVAGILAYPMCDYLSRDTTLNEINFDNRIASYTWGRINESNSPPFDPFRYAHFVNFTDSTFDLKTITPENESPTIQCTSKLELKNNMFRVSQIGCQDPIIPKYIYGFVQGEMLYMCFEQMEFELDGKLKETIENRRGWSAYEKPLFR